MKKSIPLVAFCLYFLKISILPSGYTEASILLILGSLAAFFEFKSNDKLVQALEDKLNQQQKELDLKSKDIESIKSHIASMKLSSSLRPLNNGR